MIWSRTASNAPSPAAISGTAARSTRPWLFRILRNLYLNQARARRARPVPISLDELESQPAGPEAQSSGVALREMQAALAAWTTSSGRS